MKVLYCCQCGTITDFEVWFTRCRCGNMEARWLDPQKGTVEVRARKRGYAKLIGMNNRMLMVMRELSNQGKHDCNNEEWREIHDTVTNAPGYLFDKSKRNCWACIIAIGSSNDVFWDPRQEMYDAGDFSTWQPVASAEHRLRRLREVYQTMAHEDLIKWLNEETFSKDLAV